MDTVDLAINVIAVRRKRKRAMAGLRSWSGDLGDHYVDAVVVAEKRTAGLDDAL
jgi:hypothetical protein